MFIIKNDHRNAFKTHDGWTTIEDGVLVGLQNVLRFTDSEAEANKDRLPSGSRFIYFPRRRWKDIPKGNYDQEDIKETSNDYIKT